MDKLTGMRVFAEVARLGSFSAASEKLELSRAMTTKHVAKLENSLDVRLLNRTTRRVSLTEVGIAYLERIRPILSEIEETELSVTTLSSEPRGLLKVVAPTNFGAFHIGRLLTEYMELYPEIKVELTLSDRPVDLVEEGMDLALRVGKLDDSSLIAIKFSYTRNVLCASPDYLEINGTPTHPEQLKEHNCLIFTPGTPQDEWRFRENGRNFVVKIDGNMRSNVGDPLRIGATKGLGLIQQPAYMVWQDLVEGRLKAILTEFEPPPRPINAIYIHRRHLSAKVRTFVTFLQENLQKDPYWETW